MRYLVLSDIHANLEALEAVLTDAPEYDSVLFLGDLIGYGPDPNACVRRVQELAPDISLTGNHDLAALGQVDVSFFNPVARAAIEWTEQQLGHHEREFLHSLPAKTESADFALAHASPRDPVWEYMETADQGPPNFERFDAPFCFVGHTHVPRTFTEIKSNGRVESHVTIPGEGDVLDLTRDGRHIVNPGGVGQPRDGDPRAAYGLLDSDQQTFAFRRVPYAIDITQRKILEAGLPPMLAARLPLGR